MQRLFTGLTQAELARGLRFVSSGETVVQEPHHPRRLARVRLTGRNFRPAQRSIPSSLEP